MIDWKLLRYAAAGVSNTIVGYAVFLALLHVVGTSPLVANIGCYVAGLKVAYALNLGYVFRGVRHSWRAVARFVSGAGSAWLINAAVLAAGVDLLGFQAELVQVVTMAAYTGSFYFINCYFVWVRSGR